MYNGNSRKAKGCITLLWSLCNPNETLDMVDIVRCDNGIDWIVLLCKSSFERIVLTLFFIIFINKISSLIIYNKN